jgi:4-hydroxy-tetrahydrodipicolinate reductase
MIRLILVGYGKMGKMIESVLNEDNSHYSGRFKLEGIYDVDNPIHDNYKGNADVAIEFSTPSSATDNIKYLISNEVKVVCGTTGWYEQVAEIEKLVAEYKGGLIYASNFSLGVNIFFSIVKHSAGLIAGLKQYDISIEETHHTHKLDKPSGTALRLAEYVKQKVTSKNKITCDKTNPLENEINIISKRTGEVVGNHKVIFDSTSDKISLEHDAKSRRGFAEGALLAAEFIAGRNGFFRFEDIFLDIIKQS